MNNSDLSRLIKISTDRSWGEILKDLKYFRSHQHNESLNRLFHSLLKSAVPRAKYMMKKGGHRFGDLMITNRLLGSVSYRVEISQFAVPHTEYLYRYSRVIESPFAGSSGVYTHMESRSITDSQRTYFLLDLVETYRRMLEVAGTMEHGNWKSVERMIKEREAIELWLQPRKNLSRTSADGKFEERYPKRRLNHEIDVVEKINNQLIDFMVVMQEQAGELSKMKEMA